MKENASRQRDMHATRGQRNMREDRRGNRQTEGQRDMHATHEQRNMGGGGDRNCRYRDMHTSLSSQRQKESGGDKIENRHQADMHATHGQRNTCKGQKTKREETIRLIEIYFKPWTINRINMLQSSAKKQRIKFFFSRIPKPVFSFALDRI